MVNRHNEKFIKDLAELLTDYDVLSDELKEYINNCYIYEKAVDIEYLDTLIDDALEKEVNKCHQRRKD